MPDKTKDEIIEGAIGDGLFGASLGAYLTGKNKRILAAGLVGTAIGASLKVQDNVKRLKMSFLYEENGVVYRSFPDGSRRFVKTIEKHKLEIPTHFTIE